MEKARALWHLSPTESELLPVDLSVATNEDLFIKAHYSLISNGTERLVAKGQVPATLADSMRVPFQEGHFHFPIKYGYSLVGEVQNTNHPWQGQLVHLLHPHQDFCRVPNAVASLVPADIPAQRATLAANMETAVNAIWDAEINIGDRVLVAGFGIIGALLTQVLAGIPGVQVWVLEKNQQRIDLAKERGFAVFSAAENSAKFDVAFHTTGQSAALQMCIDELGFEGKVIELSWYGDQSVQINLGGDFHSDRKQIISSQVGQLAANHQARWDYQRRKELVFELLKNPVYDHFIHQIIPFKKTPEFFQNLRDGKEGLPGVCIEY